MKISIPSPSKCCSPTRVPPIGKSSILTWNDAVISKIKRAVHHWEETKPRTPSPPIMDIYCRVDRIVYLTGMWPIDIVTEAEDVGFELPTPKREEVVNVIGTIYALRKALADSSYNNTIPITPSEWEEKNRKIINPVEIVSPDVNCELGHSYMIRHPSSSWWVYGEERNQYVPAGEGILFRRDENVYQIPLEPLPKPPAEFKEWTWSERFQWKNKELAKIPKKTVTVICEYGSRRYAEGEPVLDRDGNVVRHRWAGEWSREMVAFLKGTPSPSPYMFDDYTGHPSPYHSTKSRAFRQEVADACFVHMHL